MAWSPVPNVWVIARSCAAAGATGTTDTTHVCRTYLLAQAGTPSTSNTFALSCSHIACAQPPAQQWHEKRDISGRIREQVQARTVLQHSCTEPALGI